MMKRTLPLLAAAVLLLATALAACNGGRRDRHDADDRYGWFDDDDDRPRYLRDSRKWGEIVEQALPLAAFTKLRTDGCVDVVFTQDSRTSVVARGNERVLAAYTFAVEDSTLVMRMTDSGAHPRRLPTMRLYVSAPVLTDIRLGGDGDIVLPRRTVLDNALDVTVDGNGDIDFDDLQCHALAIRMQGNGDLFMRRAHCRTLVATSHGNGDAKLRRLDCTGDATVEVAANGDIDGGIACRNLRVEVTGAGEADLKVRCDTVAAFSTGSGELELKGRAARLLKRESGFGKILTRKLQADEVVIQ